MAGQKISAMSLVAAVTEDMKFPTDQSDGNGGNLAATAQQIADFTGGSQGGDFWPLDGTGQVTEDVIIEGQGHLITVGSDDGLNDHAIEIGPESLYLRGSQIHIISELGSEINSVINISSNDGTDSSFITLSGSTASVLGPNVNLISSSGIAEVVVSGNNIEINGDTGAIRVNNEAIIESKTVAVSSAEILASNTPKTIIAAPGSGKFIQVLGIEVSFDYGGVTYTGGGTGYFFRYNNAGTEINTVGFSVAHTADRIMRCAIEDDTFGQATSSIENKPITISTSVNYATGNGTFKVFISYRVITL